LAKSSFVMIPSFEQVIDYMTDKHEAIEFDIETVGSMVRCLALSDKPNEAICIPFISFPNQTGTTGTNFVLFPSATGSSQGTSHWPQEHELAIIRELDRVFRSEVPLIAHNFPFDSVILAREFGISFKQVSMDTMLAHHTCYCELPKGLDFLCSFYTRVPYYSDYDA